MQASDPGGGWRVVAAHFEQSAAKVEQCPPSGPPEFAIAGRSNVGKSSLLNALCGQRGLARVSRTPGRTQLLNCFALDLQGPGGRRVAARCVDLPGYGFAAAAASIRNSFAPMIEGYLSSREQLRGLVLLVDIRRGVQEIDRALIGFMSSRGLPTLLVVTKADKLGVSKRGVARRKIAETIGARPSDLLLTSASKGLGIDGPDGLAADIVALLAAEPPTENEDNKAEPPTENEDNKAEPPTENEDASAEQT